MAGTSSSSSALSVVARLHAALNKPLYLRCAEITKILEEYSLKELHSILPLLLDSIFGFNNQIGWGLGRLNRHHYADFHDVRRLLGPDGPLLQVVHKLLPDPYFKYEFPVNCLPAPSRMSLEEGVVLPFYVEKLQFPHGHAHGQPYTMLALNAFEYFFFHFAYFLVNPHSQRLNSSASAPEGLYSVLLEDYLNYFLPPDGRPAPSIPYSASPAPIRSPLHQSPSHRQSPSVMGYGSPLAGRLHSSGLGKGLLRHGSPSHRNIFGSPNPRDGSRSFLAPPNTQAAPQVLEQETWRSQTFLQILVEFWLNQNSIESERMNSHSKGMHRTGAWYNPHYRKYDPIRYMLLESYLPSADQVRIVRMIVKHLHYFVNSAQFLPNIMSPWDQLKRVTVPQMIQKKIYTFLKHSFERWPLDSSFRLVLETWLSYIQPWRYTPQTLHTHEREQDSKEKIVENKWLGFVMENLLFYSQLFQDFLPRAFRMDLVAPKNAYMLFRVTKVFTMNNLKNLLEEAETCLFEGMSRHSQLAAGELGSSFLSSGGSHTNFAANMNQQMSELEGPGYQYQRLFSQNTAMRVYELLGIVATAKVSAASAQSRNDNGDTSLWSWLGFGSSVDYNTSPVPDTGDDYGGGGDVRKLEVHLDMARDNLAEMFDIEAPEVRGRGVTWGDTDQRDGQPESLEPDFIQTDQGPQLTPLGRYQLINGLRKFEFGYQGDPDLMPISSYESAFLVRIFYRLCKLFNDKYEDDIQQMYYRDNFWGRFCCQYLSGPSPPKSPLNYKRAASPQSQRRWETHPRLTLRWLASYKVLGYLAVIFLFLNWFCGIGCLLFLSLLLCCVVLYGVIGALVHGRPTSVKSSPTLSMNPSVSSSVCFQTPPHYLLPQSTVGTGAHDEQVPPVMSSSQFRHRVGFTTQ